MSFSRNRGKRTSIYAKAVRRQMVKIKKDLIADRNDPKDLSTFNKQEHGKVFAFMRKAIRELTNTTSPSAPTPLLPQILIPTLTIKTKAFIKENCPSYIPRLKK